MGHRGPYQVDSARDYFFQGHERCIRVRHGEVMFNHFHTLPPYVLRDVLLGTTQQSQSMGQTYSETIGGGGGSPSKTELN